MLDRMYPTDEADHWPIPPANPMDQGSGRIRRFLFVGIFRFHDI